MKKIKTIITVTGASVLLFSCGTNSDNRTNLEGSTTKQNASDAEYNKSDSELRGIKIGAQTWASKNLDVSSFRNGEAIPEAKTDVEWTAAGEQGKPAWCYYDNDPANGTKYGKLYNWYAVNDPRGLAPKGWHIPSDEEWTTLTDNLGGEHGAGTQMKSSSGWNDNGNGSNSSGFAGLSGGSRYNSGAFDDVGGYGYWWSSTEINTADAWPRVLFYANGDINRGSGYKVSGFSVRCLRD